MFDRFTDNAKEITSKAHRHCRAFFGSEHFLLGMLEVDCIALELLRRQGQDLDDLRADLASRLEPDPGLARQSKQFPFTAEAKRVLKLAIEEAAQAGDGYIGTEHMLLGMLREPLGLGGQVLRDRGITPDAVHEQIERLEQELRGEGS